MQVADHVNRISDSLLTATLPYVVEVMEESLSARVRKKLAAYKIEVFEIQSVVCVT